MYAVPGLPPARDGEIEKLLSQLWIWKSIKCRARERELKKVALLNLPSAAVKLLTYLLPKELKYIGGSCLCELSCTLEKLSPDLLERKDCAKRQEIWKLFLQSTTPCISAKKATPSWKHCYFVCLQKNQMPQKAKPIPIRVRWWGCVTGRADCVRKVPSSAGSNRNFSWGALKGGTPPSLNSPHTLYPQFIHTASGQLFSIWCPSCCC